MPTCAGSVVPFSVKRMPGKLLRVLVGEDVSALLDERGLHLLDLVGRKVDGLLAGARHAVIIRAAADDLLCQLVVIRPVR